MKSKVQVSTFTKGARALLPALALLISLSPRLPVSAASAGDWQVGVKSADGPLTPYWVTLSNGQVLGKTAGVPAAVTPLVSGDLTPYLTSATAASTYQPLATILTTLANLSNATGVLTNDGAGVFSYIARGTGGATTDAGKIAVFDGLGGLRAANDINVYGSQHSDSLMARLFSDATSGGLQLTRSGGAYAVTFRPGSLTANRTLTVPNATGTIALTSDITGTNSGTNTGDQTITLTGDVTGSGTGSFAATLANTAVTAGSYTSANITVDAKGRITAAASGSSGLTIGTTTITGASAGDLLTSDGTNLQKLTPGTGVSTWLATPTVANLNSAVSDADLATTGANTFSAAQSGTDFNSSGRFYGASQPGYPQFTETGYSGNGMRVYSDRVDFWIGGSVQFGVYSGQANFASSAMAWSGNVLLYGNSDGTGRLVQRNAANAQAFSVANTYTSFTSKEEVEIGWTSNVAHLWTLKGSGGGTARDLVLGFDSTEKARVSSSGFTIGSTGTAIASIKRASATLVAGTVTVSDTATTANTVVLMSVITPGGTVGTLDYDVSAGSSYTINSSSATDTSTINLTVFHFP